MNKTIEVAKLRKRIVKMKKELFLKFSDRELLAIRYGEPIEVAEKAVAKFYTLGGDKILALGRVIATSEELKKLARIENEIKVEMEEKVTV